MIASPQGEFADALLDPQRALPPGLRVWHGGDPRARFNVYRNNVVHSLWQGLATTFAATRAWLGDEDFQALAIAYLRQQPPRQPRLAAYGQGFPDFLAGHPVARERAWLPDLARLEWLRVDAYHAADAEPLPTSAFALLLQEPDRLADTRLRLHPAARWLDSPHALASAWRAGLDGALAAPIPATPEPVLIVRPKETVTVLPVPVGTPDFLYALAAGVTLAEAAAQAAAHHARFDLAAQFTLLIQHGLAVAFD